MRKYEGCPFKYIIRWSDVIYYVIENPRDNEHKANCRTQSYCEVQPIR